MVKCCLLKACAGYSHMACHKSLQLMLALYLDERVVMAGRATPSASPKKARAAKRARVEWLAAQGVRSVDKDHNTTPHASTLLPPYLSTKTPPTTEENMYPHKNDDCNISISISNNDQITMTKPNKEGVVP